MQLAWGYFKWEGRDAVTQWNYSNQFKKHEVGKSRQRKKGQMAFNEFGRPEGIFVYGNDRTTQTEFTIDIDLKKVRKDQPVAGRMGLYQPADYNVDVVSIQFLCPKCHSPLFIYGPNMPDGKDITIHWDKMTPSNNDGLFRPLVTVNGLFACDYFDSEINETKAANGIVMKCGFRGGMHLGRVFDHESRILRP